MMMGTVALDAAVKKTDLEVVPPGFSWWAEPGERTVPKQQPAAGWSGPCRRQGLARGTSEQGREEWWAIDGRRWRWCRAIDAEWLRWARDNELQVIK